MEDRKIVEENVFPFNGAASFYNFCAPEKFVGKPFKEIHRIRHNFRSQPRFENARKRVRIEIRLKKRKPPCRERFGNNIGGRQEQEREKERKREEEE